ncbi:MAG: hypothetical protein HFG53_13725 [Lachnospiraceae bacterium]|nr:hypothetical protein [Lachnospiraceae bacterium]
MAWYLLKTWVGKEEELAREFRSTVPSHMYQECFVIYQERIWRKQQRSVVHVEPLLPGCVFLTCEETNPFTKTISFYDKLRKVPFVSRLMINGNLTILPVMRQDEEFLYRISGRKHLVELSYVTKDEDGQICKISDPLKTCREQIVRVQLKKRYAMVRHRLWGEDQAIVLGIMLKEDANQKILYGNGEEGSFSNEKL